MLMNLLQKPRLNWATDGTASLVTRHFFRTSAFGLIILALLTGLLYTPYPIHAEQSDFEYLNDFDQYTGDRPGTTEGFSYWGYGYASGGGIMFKPSGNETGGGTGLVYNPPTEQTSSIGMSVSVTPAALSTRMEVLKVVNTTGDAFGKPIHMHQGVISFDGQQIGEYAANTAIRLGLVYHFDQTVPVVDVLVNGEVKLEAQGIAANLRDIAQVRLMLLWESNVNHRSRVDDFELSTLVERFYDSDNDDDDHEEPTDDSLPEAQAIINRLKTTHPNNSHPRIMATEQDFDRIRNLIDTDPHMKRWYDQLKSTVTNSFDQPLPTYVRTSSQGFLLSTSRRVLRDVQQLGMMYKIEQDGSYVERAWDILHAAGEFPDWNPDHFLDIAEMLAAFGIAYDWMYEGWTEQQQSYLRSKMVSNGLNRALQAYRGDIPSVPYRWAGWVNGSNNWNTVSNGGIAIAALAIADESEELELMAGELLESGLRSFEPMLETFAPDGGGEEGVGYWDYNAQYYVYYMASLESALGTSYGMTDALGIAETAFFPIYLAGPNGSFNYGDSTTGIIQNPIFYWFARKFDNPDIAKYHLPAQGNQLSLLWYDPDLMSDDDQLQLDSDRIFSKIAVGSMRSAWNDPYASFVGFKGGDNRYNHMHSDLGTFVFDALGVRWAHDLGGDSYSLPDYFGAGRSNIYRLRTEGQNTLVINPEIASEQKREARADIVKSGFTPQEAYMVTDLSEAYEAHATNVKRGIALVDHRRNMLVQDEISLKEPGEIYWFMHTLADVEVADHGKSAWLSNGDKKVWAHILTSGDDVVFEIRDPRPLLSSPDLAGNGYNAGSKLTIHVEDTDSLQLSVIFIPLYDWEEAPAELPAIVSLDQWAAESSAPSLSDIQLNGESIPGFRPDKFTYHVNSDSFGQTIPYAETLTSDAGLDIEIEQAVELPGVATITVQSTADSQQQSEYKVYFYGNTNTKVEASDHDGNLPVNTIDNRFSTRWSADGDGQWIQYQLDEMREIGYVDIAFLNGSTNKASFIRTTMAM